MASASDDFEGRVVLGIDLGTTNSAVAVWSAEHEEVVALPADGGGILMPSAVGWDRDRQRFVVGDEAIALALDHPADVAYSIKRYIGRAFDDREVTAGRRLLAYDLVPGDGRDPLTDVQVQFGDGEQRLSAPSVSAKVLAALRDSAARQLAMPVGELTHAVVTVPAHFNVRQRKATKLAAAEAGFERVEVLNEPTAAALATARDLLTPEPAHILVFDLGGGTFDIALLEASRDEDGYVFDTRIVDGDTHLGGDDIDSSLAQWLRTQLHERFDVSVEWDDHAVRDALRHAAEHAKVELSTRDTVEVPIELPGAQREYRIEVARRDLEERAGAALERTRKILHEAIEDVAAVRWDEIDQVILVGGQTLMPAVRREVAEIAGREPRSVELPQLAVALGAGEYAHMLSLGRSRFSERTLINVLALPLGIRLDENRFVPLVDANKTVPHRSQPFTVTTTKDDQPHITVEVLQGRRGATSADDCVPLGILEMETMPAPARTPQFEITFDVQDDATLQVIVVDTHRDRSEKRDIGRSRRILAMRAEGDVT